MYIFMFIDKNDFNANNLYFIVVTLPDTKYGDREKKREKTLQGFLAHSDKSLISL